MKYRRSRKQLWLHRLHFPWFSLVSLAAQFGSNGVFGLLLFFLLNFPRQIRLVFPCMSTRYFLIHLRKINIYRLKTYFSLHSHCFLHWICESHVRPAVALKIHIEWIKSTLCSVPYCPLRRATIECNSFSHWPVRRQYAGGRLRHQFYHINFLSKIDFSFTSMKIKTAVIYWNDNYILFVRVINWWWNESIIMQFEARQSVKPSIGVSVSFAENYRLVVTHCLRSTQHAQFASGTYSSNWTPISFDFSTHGLPDGKKI